MELTSFAELESTREKLHRLERVFEEQEKAPARNDFVKQLSQRSLKRLIHQLKEDIVKFETRSRNPDLGSLSSPAERPIPSAQDELGGIGARD